MNNDFIHTGFNLPDDYFNVSAEEILSKTVHANKDGFSVPKNYFEDLEQSILNTTVYKKETKVVWLNPLIAVASVAACLILFLVIYPSSSNNNNVEGRESNIIAVQEVLYDTFVDEENTDEETFSETFEDEGSLNEYAFLLELPDKEESKNDTIKLDQKSKTKIIEKKITSTKTEVQEIEQIHEDLYELFVDEDEGIDSTYYLESYEEEFEEVFL